MALIRTNCQKKKKKKCNIHTMDEFLEETEPVKKQTNKKEKRNKQEQKHHFLAYF